MTIATRSASRYFDLDAVRSGPSPDPLGRGNPNGAGRNGDPGRYDSNPAGAPPLDWWEIPTHGYPGSHYATFPPALLTRPILAMCPHRVCVTCGKPSTRITEPTEEYAAHRAATGDFLGGDHDRGRGMAARTESRPGSDPSRLGRQVDTIGWTDCEHGTWRAGHVLDPFGGSGTTGLVATGHGRDCTLIDLDARNADLARERIGLFLEVVEPTRVVVPPAG